MRDRILALDLATRTGWAMLRLRDGACVGSGAWNSAPTKRNPCRWSRWLDGLLEVASPRYGMSELAAIAVEAQIERDRAWGNGRIAAGLRAHLELWAHRRQIEIVEFAPATVKKWAGGSGRASKADVAAKMASRFRMPGLKEGDEADALAVGVTALELLDIEALKCGEIKRIERAPVRREKAKAA